MNRNLSDSIDNALWKLFLKQCEYCLGVHETRFNVMAFDRVDDDETVANIARNQQQATTRNKETSKRTTFCCTKHTFN